MEASHSRRFVRMVTITGADDDVEASTLTEYANRFPFEVEWGILFSAKRAGSLRYPCMQKIQEIAQEGRESGLNLCAHICGRVVREIVRSGNWGSIRGMRVLDAFQRIQLNFKDNKSLTSRNELVLSLRDNDLAEKQIIYLDGQEGFGSRFGNFVPLFDRSGGRGTLPSLWPFTSCYAGYAGGLSPYNLEHQLQLISPHAHDDIWIDTETKVRDDEDRWAGEEVLRFLGAAEPWTIHAVEEKNE